MRPSGHGRGPATRSPNKGKAAEASLLLIGERGFHVVPTLLLLLRLLGEYLAFQDTAPAFTPEIARRVIELLKVCLNMTLYLHMYIVVCIYVRVYVSHIHRAHAKILRMSQGVLPRRNVWPVPRVPSSCTPKVRLDWGKIPVRS